MANSSKKVALTDQAPRSELFDRQMSTSSSSSSESNSERETWNKKLEFLLSVIGFAVDLSNVWRFPYLCFKNGGGAFLVPYLIMLSVGGIPLFFMELALGQYNRRGAITCWGKVSPLFKGIGYTMVMIAFYVDLYYNLLIAWALHFFFASFSINSLPWTRCDGEWNTGECNSVLKFNTVTDGNGTSAADEYFNRGLLGLHQSKGIDDLGQVKWDIALCLFLTYLICYFSIWKGISTSSKVVWFTALFPYFVLVMLLINSINLPGAKEGILYYITPDFSKLTNPGVWTDAATQVFFSLGPGFGVLLAYSSYNKFNNNVYRDALITSTVNSATSFLAGFVIFSVLGYMAHKLNKDVSDIAIEGPGLVFIVYPEAIATMPAPSFWSVMFFLMLLTLGLDSSFGGSEAIITALSDEYELIRKNREIFVACLFSFYFLVGLTTCTEGGVYIFQLLDSYAAGYSILVTVLCEAIVISWIYGIKRFSNDLKEMLGFEIGWWWKFCWVFIAPLFLLTIIIYGLINYQPISYQDYVYPKWANVIGWCIAFSSMSCIPIMACYQMAKASGSFTERLRHCITPVNHSKSSTLVSSDCKNVRLSSINSITCENNRQTNNDTVYV